MNDFKRYKLILHSANYEFEEIISDGVTQQTAAQIAEQYRAEGYEVDVFRTTGQSHDWALAAI